MPPPIRAAGMVAEARRSPSRARAAGAALPPGRQSGRAGRAVAARPRDPCGCLPAACRRSEEHTSELQSQFHLVCRLLLEKKKKIQINHYIIQRQKKDNQ